ncbi:MAG: periplasmic heavy metal sensor [Desulfomonile tiedjei]|uniref:Periplasmic heavy metal sensor n=1 Tax=Desulfomonile tiedjei TaxID=2358 RepID=A0A9D6Z2Q0_9BACT|nr:periplasmic heavy metal sensor [Desulfomonile tiedjei]
MSNRGMFLIIVTALVLTMAAVSSAAADPSKEEGGATLAASPLARLITGNIGRLLVLRSELNVTDQQRKNIAAEIKSRKDEIRPVAKDVFEKRQALREAVLNKPGDEKAIMAAANDLGKAIGNAAVLASRLVAQVKPMLTDEQQERIKSFKMTSDKAVTEWINQIGK